MTMPIQKPGRSKQNYATPNAFIKAVEDRYGNLTFDLAAEPTTRKATDYFTEDDDALSKDWSQLSGNLWLNPPFANIEPWARKCAETKYKFQNGRDKILFLVPASIGSNWFAKHVWPHAFVVALNGRLCFDGKGPFPKDCMLCIFSRSWGAGFQVWRWSDDC